MPRVLYLTTIFPRFSETFLQREISYLLGREEIQFDICSMWGGPGKFAGPNGEIGIKTSSLRNLPRSLCRILPWILKRPAPVARTLQTLMGRKIPMLLNWAENNWGFAWAFDHASSLLQEENRPDLIHATWGTMPAAAAFALHHFTGIPYSMEAHAYDVYKHGGDWLLDQKTKQARFVRSSTQATLSDLMARRTCNHPEKYHLIRRGIIPVESGTPLPRLQAPLRILTVGRMVGKKNISYQLQIYRILANRGFPFEAHIVGKGPLLPKLKQEAAKLGLDSWVTFYGRKAYPQVEQAYKDADILLFTGKPAADGDRDGLPNVVAEAMTHGLPVLTTPIAGACEAVHHKQTGFVLPYHDPTAWADFIEKIHMEPGLDSIRENGRTWIRENFNISQNAGQLCDLLLQTIHSE